MAYVDTYVSSTDLPTLQNLAVGNFINVTQISQGTPDVPATYEADGVTSITPEIPAKGVVGTYYVLIRATFDLTPFVMLQAAQAAAATPPTPQLSVVDAVTGASICGVFA